MIQDIAPHRYRNEYIPLPPDPDSFLLYYDGRKVLLRHTPEGIAFPTFAELEGRAGGEALYKDYTYLFTIDRARFYLGEPLPSPLPEGYAWEDTWLFRSAAPRYLSFAGVTGWQLSRWYASRRFCGRCGARTVPDGQERMLRCPACGQMEYPKLCPAVIIAVTHGDRLLMTKYAGREYTRYALIAGFTEIGETLEETVRREVMEEVGLRVKNITYYKSQPWSFTDTLLMGFFCQLDGDGEDVILDENELSLAQWFDRAGIPVEYDGCSLTNEMICLFKGTFPSPSGSPQG